jgi:flagellin-like hook-associated protein FlgL
MKSSELKQLIKEEIKKALKEETNNLLEMLQDYISAHYTVEEGWGVARSTAKTDMERIKEEIIKIKGEEYFDDLNTFADTNTYNEEYGGSNSQIQKTLEEYSQKLGFTIRQLNGLPER